ncbi:unnamed protein product [Vitrella brassicaformis CCMP3155]|uniref:Magnesium transporter n=1 Tax=Vitrella brassicaformis (strain CCMP3155) TaxID=1169540 RepID=A0A0G4FI22_VITBC|nr:unnamed protein product [Vitrella brassicaformis CCMP3155]|eukprot:CEM13102.1 unnamed protein product [Vitrella brassicaformis CCMP3155]
MSHQNDKQSHLPEDGLLPEEVTVSTSHQQQQQSGTADRDPPELNGGSGEREGAAAKRSERKMTNGLMGIAGRSRASSPSEISDKALSPSKAFSQNNISYLPHYMVMGKRSRKVRKHVVIEITAGRHRIREWQAAEVVRHVLSHNKAGLVEELSGCLTYRDVRQVFAELKQLPSVEVRRHCILICFPPVTAIILHDAVLLLMAEELTQSEGLIQRLTQLSEGRKTRRVPFEFSALEVVLATAIEAVGEELTPVEEAIEALSLKLERQNPTTRDLEALHRLKAPTAVLESKIQGFHRSIAELMEEPTDLLKMELSRLYEHPEYYDHLDHQNWGSLTLLNPMNNVREDTPASMASSSNHLRVHSDTQEDPNSRSPTPSPPMRTGRSLLRQRHRRSGSVDSQPQQQHRVAAARASSFMTGYPPYAPPAVSSTAQHTVSGLGLIPNSDLDILLEYFDQEVDELVERTRMMKEKLVNIEYLITIRLDIVRNRLMLVDTSATVISGGLAMGAVITGAFGMNLTNELETDAMAFEVVVAVVVSVFVLTCLLVGTIIYSTRL